MGAENPTRARGQWIKQAWEWLRPHLPGAVLEFLVFVLVALPATFVLEQRISGRQEVQENIRFARELSIQNGGNKPMNGIDLHGANLRGLQLGCRSNETIADVRLCKESPLKGLAPDAAQLIDANLAGADLSLTNLDGAMMVQANLSGATLARASLTWANLADANLVGAYLSAPADIDTDHLGYNLTISGADLRNATLDGANMTGANLKFARLNDADLTGAKLVGADLTHTQFSGADLTGADLTDTELDTYFLDSVCFDDETRWPKSFSPPSNPNGCKAESS
jgi:uncharacterized protein YjbI with pentapeptide repeats